METPLGIVVQDLSEFDHVTSQYPTAKVLHPLCCELPRDPIVIGSVETWLRILEVCRPTRKIKIVHMKNLPLNQQVALKYFEQLALALKMEVESDLQNTATLRLWCIWDSVSHDFFYRLGLAFLPKMTNLSSMFKGLERQLIKDDFLTKERERTPLGKLLFYSRLPLSQVQFLQKLKNKSPKLLLAGVCVAAHQSLSEYLSSTDIQSFLQEDSEIPMEVQSEALYRLQILHDLFELNSEETPTLEDIATVEKKWRSEFS